MNEPFENQEFSLREISRILVNRRWMIVLVAAGVFLVATILTFLQQPIYRASATIQVEGPAGAQTIFNSFDRQMFNVPQYNSVLTEMQIIKSRSIAEEVVRRLRLNFDLVRIDDGLKPTVHDAFTLPAAYNKDYRITIVDETGSYRVNDILSGDLIGEGMVGQTFSSDIIYFNLDLENPKPGASLELRFFDPQVATKALLDTTGTEEVGESTNLFRLSVFHPDPKMSREIVNTLTEVYLERNIKRKSQEASQTLDFINTQLDVIKAGLELSETEIDRFKTEEGIVALDQETTLIIDSIANYEAQRSELQLKRKQINALERRIRESESAESLIFSSSAVEDEVLSNLVRKFTDLQLEKQQALATYTERHPDVVRLNAQIISLKAQILAAIVNARQATDSMLSGLDELIGRLDGRIRGLPQAERQLARLVRTSRVNEEIYTYLLKKHEEARIVKAATVANIRVIDPGIIPSRPVKPNIKMNMIAGMLIGLLLGIIAAIGTEYLDDTVKSIEQIESEAKLSVFGTIPQVNSLNKGNGLNGHRSASLITNFDSHSPYSEAYRALRTNTQFLGLENPFKVLLFTSALQQEGKSTTSSNLAITTANMGTKTLLIDCDLRRPSLHKLFDNQHEQGLTNVVMGAIDWKDAVQDTGVENLDIITSGPMPPNPSELLASGRMRGLIEKFRENYEMVIIDSPPVIAVTDAAILSTMVDGAYIVVEAGKTPMGAVMRTKSILDNVQGNVCGVVLNNISADHGSYYGYYHYYHYNYYSYYTSNNDEKKHRHFLNKAAEKIRGLIKS
jgi:tyrosine-protein kinase Etk/Wzc